MKLVKGPANHTAEDATVGELWRASLHLLVMLVVLALLIVPVLRDLPLGQSTRTGLLAWLLVASEDAKHVGGVFRPAWCAQIEF